MKKIFILGTVVLFATGLIVVAMMQVNFAGRSGPSAQFDYPIIWQQSREPDSATRNLSQLKLEEDGTAHLLEIRVGGLGRDESGRVCVLDRGVLLTGEARWEIDADGALQVTSDANRAVFLPGSGRFSGSDWSELSEYFCDQTSINFSPALGDEG